MWIRPWAAWLALALLLAPHGVRAAGEDEFDEDRAQEMRAAIAERRAGLAERIATLSAKRDAEDPASPLQENLDEEVGLVERIDRIYAEQTGAILRAGELSRALEQAQLELEGGPESQITSEPPFPLALFDGLWDALESHRLRLAGLERSAEGASDELERARERLEERERERRETKEALGRVEDEAERASLRRALRLAELASELAQARRELYELELENARRLLALQRSGESLLRRTVEWVEDRLAVSDEDLAGPLEAIRGARFELERSLERAKRELDLAERRLRAAESRLEQTGSDAAAAELSARQQAQTTALRRIEFLERSRARLDAAERWWQRRVSTLAGRVERVELVEWTDELDEAMAESARREARDQARLVELRDEVRRLRDREAAAQESGDPRHRWIAQQRVQLEALVRLFEDEVRSAAPTRRLMQRTRRELAARTQRFSPAERLEMLGQQLSEAWNTEIMAVDDRPITPGKIITALVLVVFGLRLSRWIAALLARILRSRTRLDEGATAALQSLSFYVLLLAFFVIALDTANIPLTVFTFVGGALAIGVGFGSQNIVNNFISGLILLAERPIKVGDLVEVEGTQGWIESIGARSTVVRTFDNTNIIVPNSTFLETNVVNWTLSDPVIRSSVDVGVAYGSPVEDVNRILEEILEEHRHILDRPEPFVRFMEFGDSALLFRAYFWVRLGQTGDRLRIQSELRFRIDQRFREAVIEIAFPQRDIHLRSAEPLSVRLDAGSAGRPDVDPEQES
ncbi:MAG: mechanosensitive ion channel domain-containing protein [Myxococcota bacterium]